jgi:SagB-type dehydrogenase family enzyme
MTKHSAIIVILTIIIAVGIGVCFMLLRANTNKEFEPDLNKEIINLPEPSTDSSVSVEQALFLRRSIRDYKDEPLTLAEVSQLVWAAQGITDTEKGFRIAPSAGALYPLEVYVVAGNVSNLFPGVYKYNPLEHKLKQIAAGDKRTELCDAALSQNAVKEGAMAIVFTGVYERTTEKYGERGIRYVYMEAGHSAQNVYLQAVSLNLGTTVIGAFEDQKVKKILNIQDNEHPLYIMPIGRK